MGGVWACACRSMPAAGVPDWRVSVSVLPVGLCRPRVHAWWRRAAPGFAFQVTDACAAARVLGPGSRGPSWRFRGPGTRLGGLVAFLLACCTRSGVLLSLSRGLLLSAGLVILFPGSPWPGRMRPWPPEGVLSRGRSALSSRRVGGGLVCSWPVDVRWFCRWLGHGDTSVPARRRISPTVRGLSFGGWSVSAAGWLCACLFWRISACLYGAAGSAVSWWLQGRVGEQPGVRIRLLRVLQVEVVCLSSETAGRVGWVCRERGLHGLDPARFNASPYVDLIDSY